ncbi:MAG TPA: hypothetical protein VHE30_09550 [Polyangiaceae bacterium]|nr:hypothetical protein [Polyangiaceae bacterium]
MNAEKRERRIWLVGLVVAGAVVPGCFSYHSDDSGCDAHVVQTEGCLLCSCPEPAVAPSGPRHGVRPDGRVDVTAAEAWPDRPPRAIALTKEDIAEACAIYATCAFPKDDESLRTSTATWAEVACTEGATAPLTLSIADRGIPDPGKNESFEFLMRGILDGARDCDSIAALFTSNVTGLACQEDGCYTTEKHGALACEGDVAVVDGKRRDCSRSGMRCSVDSPTGCTDRPLTLCESPAKDRCDGDVKLGCDGCGFVSYHDCSWNGGRCVETPDGAECQDPADAPGCPAGSSTCTDGHFDLCVAGSPVTVNCAEIGAGECRDMPPLSTDGGSIYPGGFCTLGAPVTPPDGGTSDAGR